MRSLSQCQSLRHEICIFDFMISRFKQWSVKLKGKKRYALLPLLAMELASIPAAAQMVHKAAFETRPLVTAVEIPTTDAGKKRYLVTSNAPFSIEATDMIGDISVAVYRNGVINGNRFGDNAQLPGAANHCASLESERFAQIYAASQKTAATPGDPVSQAVIMEFRFSTSAKPRLKFVAEGKSLNKAAPC